MGNFNGMAARRPARTAAAPAATLADRTRLIRAIHAAARQRGLDADTRHDLQLGATGKASLTDMDGRELTAVLTRLNGAGRAATDRPHVGKVRALWWSLYWLGAIDSTDAKATDAFVQRQTGIAALRFLDHSQAASVIEALKAWGAREGVDWPAKPNLIGDRRAVIAAIGAKLSALTGSPADLRTTGAPRDLDAAIRHHGRQLREAMGRR